MEFALQFVHRREPGAAPPGLKQTQKLKDPNRAV